MSESGDVNGWPREHLSVLHVVSYYPPDRVGGVGEHVRIIHEGHVAMGIDSEVLTSGLTTTDPRVHRVGSNPTSFVMSSWRKLQLARGRDVVHAHHGEGLLFLLLLRMHRPRPRILVMFHVDVRQRETANRRHSFEGKVHGPRGLAAVAKRFTGLVKATVERAAWMLADAVVVETRAVREELSDLRPRKEVSVVSHGLGPARHSRGDESPERVELLFVGTPGIRKRTHILPSVLHRIRQQVPDARLRIVGFEIDGDPSLRLEAERLGVLSAIDFVGSVKSEEISPFYRSADVLILPSAYEGLPMVLLEAMREGLVPVATAVSGHPEAIDDGVNGYLVALDDLDAMADRCVSLLRNKEALQEMGKSAKKVVTDRFALDAELLAHQELYEALTQFAASNAAREMGR